MPMSNSRDSVVKVGHVLLMLLLPLLLLLVPHLQAQDIPPLHHNSFVRENELGTFENSHILVKNRENDRYLYKEVPRNFTFSISQNGSFLITVSPCASEITWTLYMKLQENKGNEWIGQQQYSLKTTEELTTRQTDKRVTFHQMIAPKGVYILGVTSLHTDSHVKIFLSTDSDVGGSIYPTVPPNNNVRVQTNKRTLTLDWPSGAIVNHHRRSVEYCVTISRIKNFQTHCEALAHLHGDRKPTFVSWGFRGERQGHRANQQRAKPIRKAPSKLIFHQCVGNKTSFTYPNVRRGKLYYIDVFIIDKDKNTASAYTGTTAKIKKRKRSRKTKMKIDTTKTINLKRKKYVELKIDTRISRLAFEVIPCSGKIPFELSYNGTKIRSKTMARRWKRQFIRNAEPGTYLMTFPKQQKRKTFATVFITSKPSRSKITMPETNKTKIYFYKNLTTCSKVTLAWMGTSVDQKYCLYKKKLKRNGKDSRRRRCLSPKERPDSELESCTSYKASESDRQTMIYNVTGLQPASWYRFDVFVSRGRSASVPYKSVKVQTLPHCNS